MFEYPYDVERDGSGWLITFPDVPGVNTDAETEAEIPQRAHDALWTMLDAYVRQRRELPAPTARRTGFRVSLGPVVDLKLMLHQGMVWNGITQAELARRLGTSATLINRLLDLDHQSQASQLTAAMEAIGVHPVMRFDPRSDMPARAKRVEAGFALPERSPAPRAAAATGRRQFVGAGGAKKR
jgi:antitoxin HicB